MTFPVNLAVFEGIIADCEGSVYVIPVSNVVSAAFMQDKDLKNSSKIIDITRYFMGNQKKPSCVPVKEGGSGKTKRIVINIEKEGVNMGLLVDRIISQQRVAVKNIPSLKLEETCFSGAVVMPDGRPALIISPERL